MRIEDPNGDLLTSVLLQITERDGERPRMLRYLRNDETIDLNDESSSRHFMIVWVAADFARAEVGLPALMDDVYKLKAIEKERAELSRSINNDLNWVRKENERISAENEEKTAALRQLQRERDPSRIEREVAERVAAATADLEKRLSVVKQENATLRREGDELRTAKKRLRDALDRAKK